MASMYDQCYCDFKQQCSLTQGERFLLEGFSLIMFTDIRDSEPPVSNCINTVIPSISTDTRLDVSKGT